MTAVTVPSLVQIGRMARPPISAAPVDGFASILASAASGAAGSGVTGVVTVSPAATVLAADRLATGGSDTGRPQGSTFHLDDPDAPMVTIPITDQPELGRDVVEIVAPVIVTGGRLPGQGLLNPLPQPIPVDSQPVAAPVAADASRAKADPTPSAPIPLTEESAQSTTSVPRALSAASAHPPAGPARGHRQIGAATGKSSPRQPENTSSEESHTDPHPVEAAPADATPAEIMPSTLWLATMVVQPPARPTVGTSMPTPAGVNAPVVTAGSAATAAPLAAPAADGSTQPGANSVSLPPAASATAAPRGESGSAAQGASAAAPSLPGPDPQTPIATRSDTAAPNVAGTMVSTGVAPSVAPPMGAPSIEAAAPAGLPASIARVASDRADPVTPAGQSVAPGGPPPPAAITGRFEGASAVTTTATAWSPTVAPTFAPPASIAPAAATVPSRDAPMPAIGTAPVNAAAAPNPVSIGRPIDDAPAAARARPVVTTVGGATPSTARAMRRDAAVRVDIGTAQIASPLTAPPTPPAAAAETAPDVRPLAVGDPAFLSKLADRITAARQGGSTRIRLSPDALGAIEVSVRRQAGRLDVTLDADDPATRQLLQNAQPQLVQMAADRGVTLGETRVAGNGSADAGSLGSGQASTGGGDPRREDRPPSGRPLPPLDPTPRTLTTDATPMRERLA